MTTTRCRAGCGVLKLFILFQLAVTVVSATPPSIKIGASLALSGKLALVGAAQQQALVLAVEDLNQQGGIKGRPVELVVEDNAGDPKTALNGVNKLLEIDGVEILFIPFSHITQAVKDRVRRAGKLMIYAASISGVAKESPLFFRDWGDAESQGATLAKAVARAGHKRVGFLTEVSEGCAAIQGSFNRTAAALGVTVLSEESYAPGETDFKPLLLRLAKKKPEAIAACVWRDGSLLMPQVKSLGMIGTPLFLFLAPFLPESDAPSVRALYEENGSVSIWLGFVESSLTPEQQRFFDRIRTRFGNSPRMEAALAYDDIMVLAAGLGSCADSTPLPLDCVAKHMEATDYTGVAGRLRFDENRLSNRADLLIRVKAGRWLEL